MGVGLELIKGGKIDASKIVTIMSVWTKSRMDSVCQSGDDESGCGTGL